MPTNEKLETGLSQLGLEPSADAIEKLQMYMDLLKEWSRTYNLIAPREREYLLERHVLDSLTIADSLKPGSLLDVGTGAGLPGIPLAIVKPEMEVTLIDGAGKKIRFIRHVARSLPLTNIEPLHQRVEDLKPDQPFANITSRAFASLNEFAEIVRPLMTENTQLLAMKGMVPELELEDLPSWIKLDAVKRLEVPGLEVERHLVIMSLATPIEKAPAEQDAHG